MEKPNLIEGAAVISGVAGLLLSIIDKSVVDIALPLFCIVIGVCSYVYRNISKGD